jgi:ketosteroid isomerase-like protein
MPRPGTLSNLETLSRISEAVEATGEPPEELVWPDFEIHEHHMPDSQLHRGLAGWRRWVADWTASFPEWEIERLETVELDDRQILTTHRIWARGRSTGMRLEERHAQLWLFRDGRVARMDYYPSEEQARRAAASS